MAQSLECSYENINDFAQYGSSSKCEFALAYCGDETTYVNTVTFYYCTLNESIVPMIAIVVPWLLLCFYWLSSTCEKYLEPSLCKIAKFFRFSESLAGVTLLAMANGAPDLISAYVASQSKQKEGINLAFGALFGASVFTTSIILARVIVAAKNLQLSMKTIVKDCGFYIIADLYFFYLGTLPKILTHHILLLFFTYLAYVIIVVAEEIWLKRINGIKVIEVAPTPLEPNNKFNQLAEDGKGSDNSITEPSKVESLDKVPIESASSLQALDGQSDVKIAIQDMKNLKGYEAKKTKAPINIFYIIGMGWEYFKTPLNLIRDHTIPRVNRHKLNRTQIALYPFFTSLLVLWQFEILSIYGKDPIFWAIFAVSTGVLGALFWILTKNPRFVQFITIVFLGVACLISVLWVRFVADLLMDLLVVIKIASGLPINFIGLTLLAWGNSANDFFVDVALAKKGHGVMAAAGIFSGQFFNMLIGFGMLLILEGGKAKLSLFDGTDQSHINYILIICSLVCLASTLTYGAFRKFNYDKKYAVYMISFYMVFAIMISLVVLF